MTPTYREHLVLGVEAFYRRVVPPGGSPTPALIQGYVALLKSLEDLDHRPELDRAVALQAAVDSLVDRVKHLEAALSIRRAPSSPQPRIA